MIEVPYVNGDSDGSLTNAIVQALSVSGMGEVRQQGAHYRLEASIAGSESQTIGYRRDRQQINGKSRKHLVASESRKTLIVTVALYENETNQIVSGPFHVEACADFDFVDDDSVDDLVFLNKGREVAVLPFSLGQLEPIESAGEAVARPLQRGIAKKIIDVIFAEWYYVAHG